MAIGKEPCYSLIQAFKSLWTPLCAGFAGRDSICQRDSRRRAVRDKPAETRGRQEAEKSPSR